MLNGSVTPPPSTLPKGAWLCTHALRRSNHTHTYTQTSLALSHAPEKKQPKRAALFSWHATCQAIPPALHRRTPTPDWLKAQPGSCKPLSHRNPSLHSLTITEKKIGEKKRKKGKTDTSKSKRHYVACRLALPSLLTPLPPFSPLRWVFVASSSRCMTFHEHQLSVETEWGERTAPTVFSIPTTSRLPSAAAAASAAAARRADAPLFPSPPLCARMLSCSVAVSVPEVSMDSSPCGGTQPHWRNAGNSCQTPPGVPALELSHSPIRPWTERHGAEDVQSDVKKATYVVVGRSRKVKGNWRVETAAPLPFPVFLVN